MIDTQLLHINLEQLKKQEINGDQKKKRAKNSAVCQKSLV
jgi:hypothetical protein